MTIMIYTYFNIMVVAHVFRITCDTHIRVFFVVEFFASGCDTLMYPIAMHACTAATATVIRNWTVHEHILYAPALCTTHSFYFNV